MPSTAGADARERIVATAYSLFCRHGIRAVGVDTIIERSGVAKMTMYRHFGSKDDLVLEVMRRREELWSEEWLGAEIRRRADSPADQLLAIFDVFDGWFHRRTFEGCLFVNVAARGRGPPQSAAPRQPSAPRQHPALHPVAGHRGRHRRRLRRSRASGTS